ncbi:class I SAM-dependent methyltransferase [Gammaproteobacteria bacterium]|nr:class I SAM-dependent methyltransferase [Gammaproteobacteria bacterium]
MKINKEVRKFWEEEACGTSPELIKEEEQYSQAWSEEIDEYRYSLEPFIYSIAQFTRHTGKTVLEIGVGAGSDHLNWARAGVDLYGVDLTDKGIHTTNKRLSLYNLKSNLQRVDAEDLPFEDNFFDIVYSWGVIHHSEDPEQIIKEIYRVLKPGGKFLGMIYHRRSIHNLNLWIKNALLKAKPWRSFKYVLYHYNESIASKAYSFKETRDLFKEFKSCKITPFITLADLRFFKRLESILPNRLGFYLGLEVIKEDKIES